MKLIKRSVMLMIIVIGAGMSWAQDNTTTEIPEDVSKVATTTCQFLKMEVGGVAASMGGSGVAYVSDLSALYLNPAGLSKISGQSFYGTYTNLYAGIQHGFVAVGTQIDRSDYLGLSVTYLNSGEMKVTTPSYPDGTGEYFSVSDLAVALTYTRVMTDRLSIGLTGKVINETIWRESATAVAFDIGSQFDTGIKGIKLGMSIRNFGTSMTFDGDDLNFDTDPDDDYEGNAETEVSYNTDTWALPLVFRLGVACDIVGPESEFIYSDNQKLTITFDGNDPLDNYLRFNLGMQYVIANSLSFRGGYHFNYDEAGLTFGLGLNLDVNGMPLNIDYALAQYGALGYINQISMQIGI